MWQPQCAGDAELNEGIFWPMLSLTLVWNLLRVAAAFHVAAEVCGRC